jgi:hypothetical protein
MFNGALDGLLTRLKRGWNGSGRGSSCPSGLGPPARRCESRGSQPRGLNQPTGGEGSTFQRVMLSVPPV